MPRVFHYSPGIVARDAIGFSLTSLHQALLRVGVPSFLVCDGNSLPAAPAFTRTVDDFVALNPGRDDLLVFHHSFLDSNAQRLLDLPCRKIIVYHNITPGHFFRRFDQAWLADACDQARDHLGHMRNGFDAVVGDSAYNAQELADCGYPKPVVIPVFYDEHFYRDSASDADAFLERRMEGTINLAFIGRYVPNKRPDNLIRIAALVKRMIGKPARLRLHGKVWDRGYYLSLRRLSEELGIEQDVLFEVNQPRDALRTSLAAADAFVSASEHEGFMVPLIEAFAVGCPVVALASSAVTETCGAAGLLVRDADLEQIAARVVAVHEDADLRRAVIRAQSARVEFFSTAQTLRKWDALLSHFLEQPLVSHAHRI